MIFSVLLILGLWLMIKVPAFVEINTSEESADVSIIVAVRNEALNLPGLFKALDHQQNIIPINVQIVFVNDHSEDETLSVLKEWSNETNFDVEILSLEDAEGKKQALKKGVEMAKYDLLLFTDADCEPSNTWISDSCTQFKDKNIDLLIGSVWYTDSSIWFRRLQQIEFAVLQSITALSTKSKYPFMCNGANLMTKKSLYLEYLEQEKTSQYKSGDDVFYLDFMINSNKDIQFSTSKNGLVLTEAMDSLSEFIQQRLRWSAKVKFYQNPKMIIPSGIFTLWSLLLPLLFILLPWMPITDFVSILVTKVVLDFILLKWYFKSFKRKFLFLDFIILEIIHPFYVFSIGILSIFKSFNWKNREAKA